LKNKKKFSRFFVLYVFAGAFFLLIFGKILYLQTVMSNDSDKSIENMLSLSEKSPAPRGEIFDRNGIKLATNRKGYIVMVKKSDAASLDLTLENLSKISGISCEEINKDLKQQGFSYNNPYVFSEDADAKIITKIKEMPDKFPCVEILTAPVREYLYPDTAVHLLGRCGLISKEEFEKLSGYSRDDTIGKQGAEKAFEEILRGTDGIRAKEKYTNGITKKFLKDIEPQAGSNVVLTIDLELQKTAEDALGDVIKNSSGAVGGAVVVMDVNSGEVLSIASNPDYNSDEFNKNYKELSKDKNKPFFNRSLSGLYEPGSTFKPITAIAALESGELSCAEKINTLGEYEYYDRVFKCNIYREKGKTHGKIDVAEALGVSCNYFFYELAKRVGIDKISDLAKDFGLGGATGIELTQEEAIGTIATPKNRKEHGGYWYAGDALQAAIGQSDNRFTPIALCNYAATLANGGTLYAAHVLKGIQDNDGKISYTEPKIINSLDILPKTLQTIEEGMFLVTKSGTAKDVFSDFPEDVAGKTGTAQVNKRTNGLFIGYAPISDPEIAFCVVVEGGASGNQAAQVAKKVLAKYFNTDEKGN